MKRISRREFLRAMATGLGGLTAAEILAACGAAQAPNAAGAPAAKASATPATVDTGGHAAPSPETSQSTTTAVSYPDLVVARGGEPGDLVRRAVAALGGMGRFVPPGSNVIIKPNICVAYHSYEYAATTNPWVVATLVELCRQAGAGRVRVMDSPFGGSAEEAYARSGIQEQVLAAGGEMEVMSGFKFVETDFPDGVSLHRTRVYDEILNADVVINVPIAKHHGLAQLTLGMKNLMGVLYDRPMMHADLGRRLADLARRVRPQLTVVDAIRILTANGPTGGDLGDVRQLDTLIASPDIVAADSYAATLFGLRPEDLAYVRAATDIGLGRSDLENLRTEELSLG